jgi:hypothetical protein
MQRRKFLLGAGSLAAAGAAAMGTGAFTSVSADRSLTVKTAGDASAYLSLKPQPNSANATEYVNVLNDNTIEIDVGSNSNGGSGVNKGAYTVIRDLIQVTNQGTQGVIFGHLQDFQPQKVFLYHNDERYKPGGSQKQAGEQFSSLGSPDNAGTNADTIATKNLPFIGAGNALNNVGLGTGLGSFDPEVTNGTVTFVAASSPDELSEILP